MKLALHLIRFGIKPYQRLLLLLAGWVMVYAFLLSADLMRQFWPKGESLVIWDSGILILGSIVAWVAGSQVVRFPCNKIYSVQPVPYGYRLLVQLLVLAAVMGFLYVLFSRELPDGSRYIHFVGFNLFPLLATCFCLGVLGLGALRSLLQLFWLGLIIFGIAKYLQAGPAFNSPLAATLGVCLCCGLPERIRERLGDWINLLPLAVATGCILFLHGWMEPYALEAAKRPLEASFPRSPIGAGLEMKIAAVTSYPVHGRTNHSGETQITLAIPSSHLLAGRDLEWRWRRSPAEPWSHPMPATYKDHLWLFNEGSEPIHIAGGQIRISGRWKRDFLVPNGMLFTKGGVSLDPFSRHTFEDELTFFIADATISVTGRNESILAQQPSVPKPSVGDVFGGAHRLAIPSTKSPESPRELVDLALSSPDMDLAPYVKKWLPEMLRMLKYTEGNVAAVITRLIRAISQEATIEHKGMILEAFQSDPLLLEIVTAKGWEGDARESIMGHLKSSYHLRRPVRFLDVLLAAKNEDVVLESVRFLQSNGHTPPPRAVLAWHPNLHAGLLKQDLREDWLVALAAVGHKPAFVQVLRKNVRVARQLISPKTTAAFSLETIVSRAAEAVYDPTSGTYFLPDTNTP